MSPVEPVYSASDVAALESMVELLEEAALDAQRMLAADDIGWSLLGSNSLVIRREDIVRVSQVARVMAAADPLIKRAVNLRIAYLGTPTCGAAQEDGAEQDLNAVVQAFLDDPANADAFTSSQACEERERTRETDGNTFHALVTSPMTGRVQVRKIPLEQITDILTDPEDSSTPWLYLRAWSTRLVTTNATGVTSTASQLRKAYYPDINWRPVVRARSIDGIPVEWDKPVVHSAVNRPENSRWGIPDTLAAIPWARGYKDFLEDWARLHKALATVAFRATSKTRRGSAQIRDKISARPVGPDGGVAGTVVTAPNQTFEAVSKSGATIDAHSSKPLAGMVASAMDVPVTMLLSDPGVTGARAVAETLDKPHELITTGRRTLDDDLVRAILGHVVREAVRAPRGPLKGNVLRDADTGRESVQLSGDQPIAFTVERPALAKDKIIDVMNALNVAHGMDVIPPLTIARLVLMALGVSDVDDVLDQITDDQGSFVPPADTTAANSALGAVGGGDMPAA